MVSARREPAYYEGNRHSKRMPVFFAVIIALLIIGPQVYNYYLAKSGERVREYVTASSELTYKGSKYIGGELEDFHPDKANQYVPLKIEVERWYRDAQGVKVPRKFEEHHENFLETMYQYTVIVEMMMNPTEQNVQQINPTAVELNRLLDADRILIKKAFDARNINYTEYPDGYLEYETYFKTEMDQVIWEDSLQQYEYYQDMVVNRTK